MSSRKSNSVEDNSRGDAPPGVFVFGISGATWQMIDPLVSQGRLPALAELISRGSRGVLRSVRASGDKHFRPQIAWPTIATGVSPQKHGITRFFHTADDYLSPTIWERFDDAGRGVGLFGWPIVWPVKPVNGFLIPGYEGRDPATYPPDYRSIRQLDRRQQAARGGGFFGRLPFAGAAQLGCNLVRNRVAPSTFAHLAWAAMDMKLRAPRELRPLLARRARLRASADIFLHLYRRHTPGFAAFVTFLADYAEHRFWMFQEPGLFSDAPREIPPRLASAVGDAYVAIDSALARILRYLHPQTIVAVLSEHGMAAEPVSTEIGPSHYVLRPMRLKELVGLDPSMPAVPVARWIALRPPAAQISEVSERLRRVQIAETELPLFQIDEHRGEVIVKLALRPGTLPGGTLPSGTLLSGDDLESLQIVYHDRTLPFTWLAERFGRRRSAMHAEEGVFILAGPGVRHADIGSANLIDIAPTLLHAAQLPSGGLDGDVLDVFEPVV